MTAQDTLDDLQWRGLIALSTDLGALRAAMDEGPITYYCGFDPSASSLHIGSLVQILTLRRLQLAGHHPIALVGGATGLIGDPKPTAERTLHDPAVVAGFVSRIREQIEPYLSFSGENAALLVNNLDWTAELTALGFLRDVGRHFRVNKMIGKEAVSARLHSDSGINFTEFSYQILQAMDFLELYRRHGCVLQTGGTDQWGNLTAGLDLIHHVEGRSVHAFATPLVTKADGTKFGKTESGTVWLDPRLTSPYAFYQFWVNADDRDVEQYLKIFSFRGRAGIEALLADGLAAPAARGPQRALAEELTTLVHGADQTQRVIAASQALFGHGSLEDLDAATLQSSLAEVPSAQVGAERGLPSVVDLFALTGLSPSRSAARRTVAEGGAYVNNLRMDDPEHAPPSDTLLHGRWLVLRRGKRNVAVVDVAGGAAVALDRPHGRR